MRVFLDTNVLLDLFLLREPHAHAARRIWALAEASHIAGIVSAISHNNIYFVLRKGGEKTKAKRALILLRDVFEVAALDSQIINQAMDSRIDDFEDAIQYCSALRAAAQFFVTRNQSDFPPGPLTILSPGEFVAMWERTQPATEQQER